MVYNYYCKFFLAYEQLKHSLIFHRACNESIEANDKSLPSSRSHHSKQSSYKYVSSFTKYKIEKEKEKEKETRTIHSHLLLFASPVKIVLLLYTNNLYGERK